MPKQSIKKSSQSMPIKRKSNRSQLSEFVENSLPSNSEVDTFEQYLKVPTSKEIMADSLSKIYEGDNGKRINVKEVSIKRRRSIWATLGFILLYVALAAGLAWGAYYLFFGNKNSASPLVISISAEQTIKANQEFTYTIDYRNQENTVLNNVEATVVYPDNFVVTDSFPAPISGNNKWRLEDIKSFSSGQIKIRGRLIGLSGQSNIIFADVWYQPEGISSTFKKSTSFDIVLAGSGFDISSDNPGSVLVGEEKNVSVSWLPQEINFIPNFSVRLKTSDNVTIIPSKDTVEGITTDQVGVWQVDSVKATKPLNFKFKILDKKNDFEELKFQFEYTPDNSTRSYIFEEKILKVDIIKNNLNLTMVANGQSGDQGVDFEQVIHYSISYANKGEVTMNDIIITAVLDGDALDWRKLDDENNGKVTSSTILWTSVEIPALKSLAKDQQGTIDFSIPVRPSTEAKLFNRLEIKSYAQFALSDSSFEPTSDNQANRSNELNIKVNSDVALDESVRYFDENNMAVGTGPLPPKVGDTTTLKVYWTIKNTLHEIGGLSVTTTLPSGVTWDGKDQVSVGSLSYDQNNNQVTWNIGRLPLSVSSIAAEFSIALKPRITDQNKLMILVSGTSLTGQDNQTSYQISKQLKAQTTKLEKDDIANTDGIVQ
jgi:hypothetical protein